MITLFGRIPSKKNSKMAIPIGRRCVLIPQKKFTDWHKVAMVQIKPFPVILGNKLRLTFFLPDLRRTDLTNKSESIMDLLVDAGKIEDDNCQIINELTLRYGGLDRENPRVEIEEYA
jgi:hypothetical protein